jgi:hypothetical protein
MVVLARFGILDSVFLFRTEILSSDIPIPLYNRLHYISWNILPMEERDAPLVLYLNRIRSGNPLDYFIFHVPIFMLALGLELV